MFRLDDKTCIVTGGGSGIGRAISQIFAQQGGLVLILDIDKRAAIETVQLIVDAGGKADFKKCDQTEQEEVAQVIQELVGTFGVPDILVNNAGLGHIGNVENTSVQDMDHLLNVNVKGVYNLLYTVLPFMKKTGGVILNMGSVAAFVGLNDRFAYSATKGAVITMTMSVAKDYLPYGIRCNSISPGRVHTPFVDAYLKKNYPGQENEMFEKLAKTQPIGRMAKPEEIAKLALYLCCDASSFITGSDFSIDGGFRTLNT